MKKRRIIAFFVVVVMLFQVMGIVSASESVSGTSGDFSYTVTDGKATISTYTGEDSVLTIPDTLDGYTVEKLGNNLFKNNTTLTEVVLPSGLTSIGYFTFSGCTALKTLTVNSDITSFGSSPFSGTTIENLHFGQNVSQINRIFTDFTSLQTITIDEENSCFTVVDQVIFSKDETMLYRYPKCLDGENYTIPETVNQICEYAFYENTSIKEVGMGEGITEIGERAFYGCSALEKVAFPKGLLTIGDYAFARCKMITSISLPASLTTLENCAFNSCDSLSQLTINGTIENLAADAFASTNITNLHIGEEATDIDDCFLEIKTLTTITAEEDNSAYSVDEEGILFSKDKTILYRYPVGKGGESYEIPEGVTELGRLAFCDCDFRTKGDSASR